GKATGQRTLAAAALHSCYRYDHAPHLTVFAKSPRKANQRRRRYRIRGKLPIGSSRGTDRDGDRAASGEFEQRPAHAIARQAMANQGKTAKQDTGPDRDAEIKRHPGNLVLPLRDAVRDHPAACQIVQAGEKSENLLTVRQLSVPP